MKTDINDFIVALLESGAALHKEGETIKATGLTLGADTDGIFVCHGELVIHPKYYGFDAKQIGEKIYFNPI